MRGPLNATLWALKADVLELKMYFVFLLQLWIGEGLAGSGLS